MRIAAWNIGTLYRAGALNELEQEMDKYRLDICAVQENSRPGKGTVLRKICLILCNGHKSDKHEFGTVFCIS